MIRFDSEGTGQTRVLKPAATATSCLPPARYVTTPPPMAVAGGCRQITAPDFESRDAAAVGVERGDPALTLLDWIHDAEALCGAGPRSAGAPADVRWRQRVHRGAPVGGADVQQVQGLIERRTGPLGAALGARAEPDR